MKENILSWNKHPHEQHQKPRPNDLHVVCWIQFNLQSNCKLHIQTSEFEIFHNRWYHLQDPQHSYGPENQLNTFWWKYDFGFQLAQITMCTHLVFRTVRMPKVRNQLIWRDQMQFLVKSAAILVGRVDPVMSFSRSVAFLRSWKPIEYILVKIRFWISILANHIVLTGDVSSDWNQLPPPPFR